MGWSKLLLIARHPSAAQTDHAAAAVESLPFWEADGSEGNAFGPSKDPENEQYVWAFFGHNAQDASGLAGLSGIPYAAVPADKDSSSFW